MAGLALDAATSGRHWSASWSRGGLSRLGTRVSQGARGADHLSRGGQLRPQTARETKKHRGPGSRASDHEGTRGTRGRKLGAGSGHVGDEPDHRPDTAVHSNEAPDGTAVSSVRPLGVAMGVALARPHNVTRLVGGSPRRDRARSRANDVVIILRPDLGRTMVMKGLHSGRARVPAE